MMTSDQQPVQVEPVTCQTSVWLVPMATSNGRRENFSSKTGMLLAKAQMGLGFLCFIFNIVSMGLRDYHTYIGLGIICGLLAMIAGGLGIGAARKKTTCLIVGNMVLSIISAAVAGCLISYTSLGMWIMRYFHSYPFYRSTLAMKSLTVISAVLVAVCGTWSSVLGCKVTCCYSKPPQTYQVVYQGSATAPVVMIQATAEPPANQGGDVSIHSSQGCNSAV